MKFEYQRKVHLLNKQKKHGVGNESLEKLTAAVSQLHTRFIVDIQSMDSTVSEINNLRDHKLYPRLVELVDGWVILTLLISLLVYFRILGWWCIWFSFLQQHIIQTSKLFSKKQKSKSTFSCSSYSVRLQHSIVEPNAPIILKRW